MTLPSSPRGFRQARCAGCGLNPEACVCRLFPRLDGAPAISVVMSRAEARSASNSARLLALWLPGIELQVRGGDGEPNSPEALLERPGTALLFPGGGRPRPLPDGVRHLIVPDGTWAQARRIERRWFAAHALPRVELDGPWPSVYELRRGRDGLCTFEAVALAIGLLRDRELAATLLGRFAEWARRARLLKAGGTPVAPLTASDASDAAGAGNALELPPHPATEVLRAMPPGTGDARRRGP